MTSDGQGHMRISELTLKVVLAELPNPVCTQSVAQVAGKRRLDREHLRHVLPHQLRACASQITHGALILGIDIAFR
jgi:hypothetical protein